MTASDLARRRFQSVVLPHLDAAYSLARGLTGNGADAEDIVQEAAVRALAALETQGVDNPRPWFLTIVRNCALTLLARRRPAQLVTDSIDDLAGDGLPEPSPDAETQLILADEAKSLRRALERLPLALREALLMRAIHGLSYRDIASATQAPIGTVMSRLARARATLAQILGDDR